MDQKQSSAGEVIFKEGDSAFLVASGMIEVSQDRDGEKKVLGEIKRDIFSA